MSTPLFEPWSPDSAARFGPPHAWIRSWTCDIDALRADVTAAGWLWRCVRQVDVDAATMRAVFDVFTQRMRACRPEWTSGWERVLLAVGPDVSLELGELKRIALFGRACGVHLAVASDHLRCGGYDPYFPVEFRSNVSGWYPGHSAPSRSAVSSVLK